MCPYEKFFKKKPIYTKYLRIFGEVGIVTDQTKIKARFNDRGFKCIFVGYTNDHTEETYRMYNMKTRKAILSRDVTWLNKFDGNYDNNKIEYIYDDDEIEVENKKENSEMSNTPGNQCIQPREGIITRSIKTNTKLPLEVRRLHTSYNNIYENLDKAFYISEEIKDDIKKIDENVESGKVEITYDEAINGPDANNWKKAINAELGRIKEHEVWLIIKRTQVPKKKKIIGCR